MISQQSSPYSPLPKQRCLSNNSGNDLFTRSIIASVIWFTWKSKCNVIFRNERFSQQKVVAQAIGHTREFFFTPSTHSFLNTMRMNFSFVDFPILLTTAVFNEELHWARVGFLVLDFNIQFVLAGCCRCPAKWEKEAELRSMQFAIQCCSNLGITIKTACSASLELIKNSEARADSDDWRFKMQAVALSHCLSDMGITRLRLFPKNWMHDVTSIAVYGLQHHEITLFHKGRDLPRWLMMKLSRNGVRF